MHAEHAEHVEHPEHPLLSPSLPFPSGQPCITQTRFHDKLRYIYADSESVGAVVETPKLLKLLMEEDEKGLEGADGVR